MRSVETEPRQEVRELLTDSIRPVYAKVPRPLIGKELTSWTPYELAAHDGILAEAANIYQTRMAQNLRPCPPANEQSLGDWIEDEVPGDSRIEVLKSRRRLYPRTHFKYA
jgi:hypothetical protein